MITVAAGVRVLVATKPVDFRRGAESLAALARERLKRDPFSGTIFIFRSKRADRLKILAWDGSGLVLLWKRLEQGTFRWPPISAKGPLTLRRGWPNLKPQAAQNAAQAHLDVVQLRLHQLARRQ